jgi:sec-independent protein translocase protein TatA
MIGTGELIVILGVVTLLFGGKKIPEFAKNLGKGVREFKKAVQGEEEPEITPVEIIDPKKDRRDS